MKEARIGGGILLVVGLLLGTLVSRTAPGAPLRGTAGYRVIAADLHVHSFPGDGTLVAGQIAREARRRGLDAVAVTNHNRTWPAMLGGHAGALVDGVLVIPGEEVTTPVGHIAAVGITHAVGWHPPLASVIDAIHRQGGVAIAAHPGGDDAPGFDAAAIARLDGVEAAHPSMFTSAKARQEIEAFYVAARAAHPGIAAVGSSDFHFLPAVGLCRTYLLVHDLSVASVLDAIRAGRTIACAGDGRAYGEPRLVSLLGPTCRDDLARLAAAPRVPNTAPALLAIAGLILLIV